MTTEERAKKLMQRKDPKVRMVEAMKNPNCSDGTQLTAEQEAALEANWEKRK